MDSLLSDNVVRLRHAIWHHAWDDAERLAIDLASQNAPADPENLQLMLSALSTTLAAAKATRMELLSSLSRLRAVTEFNHAPERQVIAAVTDF